MNKLLAISCMTFILASELEVDGNLTVTGNIQNDSLEVVISNLQSQIQILQSQVIFLQQQLGLIDCNGVFGGNAVIDVCGICDGDGSTCTIEDIDGNIYTTILFGNQRWINSNLKTSRYKDGSQIENSRINTNSISGYFYDWYAATDSRGVCPDGYHVPSDDEFKELEIFLGMSEEDANNGGWRGIIAEIFEDPLGFNIIYAGHVHPTVGTVGVNVEAAFSTTTPESENYQIVRLIDITRDEVNRNGFFKTQKMNIRCLQD